MPRSVRGGQVLVRVVVRGGPGGCLRPVVFVASLGGPCRCPVRIGPPRCPRCGVGWSPCRSVCGRCRTGRTSGSPLVRVHWSRGDRARWRAGRRGVSVRRRHRQNFVRMRPHVTRFRDQLLVYPSPERRSHIPTPSTGGSVQWIPCSAQVFRPHQPVLMHHRGNLPRIRVLSDL